MMLLESGALMGVHLLDGRPSKFIPLDFLAHLFALFALDLPLHLPLLGTSRLRFQHQLVCLRVPMLLRIGLPPLLGGFLGEKRKRAAKPFGIWLCHGEHVLRSRRKDVVELEPFYLENEKLLKN